MNEETTPGSAAAPEVPADPAAQQPEPPTGWSQSPPPAPAKSGKWRPILILGVLAAIIGVVLFAVQNNVAADDLKVGDCFNIPNGTTISTVEKHACTESHNAEVIFAGDYTGTTFPISLSLDSFIDEQCVPAFETYVGRSFDSEPALEIGYFHPTREGWDSGDRTITCYVSQPGDTQMTESLKG